MNFLQKYTILKHFVRSRLDAIRPRCDFLSKSPLPKVPIDIDMGLKTIQSQRTPTPEPPRSFQTPRHEQNAEAPLLEHAAARPHGGGGARDGVVFDTFWGSIARLGFRRALCACSSRFPAVRHRQPGEAAYEGCLELNLTYAARRGAPSERL